MNMNFIHPEYKKMLPTWKKCGDCYLGEDKIKEERQRYLPQLEGQTAEGYEIYLFRSYFINAFKRTIDAFSGLVNRRVPNVEVDDIFNEFLNNATQSGDSFNEFIEDIIAEYLIKGRVGIVFDFDEEGDFYITSYKAENIINWEVVNGQLTNVLVTEPVLKTDGNVFGFSEVNQEVIGLRQFVLDEGIYKQFQYIYDKETDEIKIIGEPIIPQYKGQPANKLPFQFIGPISPVNPPLLDLANVNLSHYRSSAELEHGRYYTAMPTVYVSNYGQTEYIPQLKVGGSSSWIFPQDAKPGILEFSGSGLSYLENALREKFEYMAVLGAKFLETQKRDSESAETVKLRQIGDVSDLQFIVGQIESDFNALFNMLANWFGLNEEEQSVELNKDFVETKMNPQELRELVMTWQQGVISATTLVYQLRQGEIIPESVSDEEAIAYVEINKSPNENVLFESNDFSSNLSTDDASDTTT